MMEARPVAETRTVDLHVQFEHRPEYLRLTRRIAELSGVSIYGVRDASSGVRHLFSQPDDPHLGRSVNGFRTDAPVINMWAELIIDGRITIDDIYLNAHSVKHDVNPKTGYTRVAYLYDMMMFELIGVPHNEREAWSKVSELTGKHRYEYIYRYVENARKINYSYGVREFRDLHFAMGRLGKYSVRTRNSVPPSQRHAQYLRFVQRIENQGVADRKSVV